MEPKADRIINIHDPDSDSVFNILCDWCVEKEAADERQADIDAQVRHILVQSDERATALVGAMLVENGVMGMLAAIMPGFKELAANRDFSASMLTIICRALNLCPKHLLAAADTVRRVRNSFAHHLEIDCFAKVKDGLRGSLRDHLNRLDPGFDFQQNDLEVFKQLVALVTVALRMYTVHVREMNAFIRSEQFHAMLKQFSETR